MAAVVVLVAGGVLGVLGVLMCSCSSWCSCCYVFLSVPVVLVLFFALVVLVAAFDYLQSNSMFSRSFVMM